MSFEDRDGRTSKADVANIHTNSSDEHSRLSIVCLIHSLCGGGAERVMAGLASRLSRRGHQVTLLTFDSADNDRHTVDPTVTRLSLGSSTHASGWLGKWTRVRDRQRRIAAAIDQANPDVLLSFCDRNNIDALMALKRSSLPVVVCERSEPAQQTLGWLWETLRRRVYRRADAVVALTDTAARTLQAFSRRVCVIPSAIEAHEAVSDRSAASERHLIVAAGRLEHEKGFDRLIEAFAIATDKTPEWKLVIYGEGSLRKTLIEQTKSLQIEQRVSFPGWITPLQPQLARATIFCLASRYEGFPSVVMESMSLGVPTLSVDCESGPRQIIEDEKNGLLVRSSVEGLARGIQRWIQNPEERESMAMQGRSVAARFDFETMVDRYERLLRSVVAKS